MVSHEMPPRAALWRRFWARLLDSLFAAMSTYLPTVVLLLFVAVFDFEPFASSDNAFGTVWLLVCALGVVAALLFEAWTLSRFGCTPGKSMLKVRVVKPVDGAKATVQQTLTRSAVPLIAAVMGVLTGTAVGTIVGGSDSRLRIVLLVVCFGTAAWLLVHVSALWDEEHRGWPDKAAGTVVVQDVPRARRRTDDETNQQWRKFLHGHHGTPE